MLMGAVSRRAATDRAIRAAELAGGVDVRAEPHDQLLWSIWHQRDRVEKLDKVMGTLVRRAGIDPQASGLRRDDPVWAAAIPATRAVFDSQQDVVKQLGNMSIQYVRLGFESRELELKESMADMFLVAITRTLEQLELTARQRRMAPRVVEESVKLLEAA